MVTRAGDGKGPFKPNRYPSRKREGRIRRYQSPSRLREGLGVGVFYPLAPAM